MGFVYKVFGILFAQMLVTSIVVCIPLFNESARVFLEENWFLMILVFIGNITTCIMIMCCGFGRKVPINYILLTIFTLCEGYMVASIASQYTPISVGIVAFMTTIMVLGLMVYAKRTKTDFTAYAAFFFMAGFAFMGFSLFAMLFVSEIMNTFVSLIGVVLFGLYLIFDMQLILGGRQYELS